MVTNIPLCIMMHEYSQGSGRNLKAQYTLMSRKQHPIRSKRKSDASLRGGARAGD